jgi:hypothetical protein
MLLNLFLIFLFFSITLHFIVEKIIIVSFFILFFLLIYLLTEFLNTVYQEKINFIINEIKIYFDLYLILYKYIKDYYINLLKFNSYIILLLKKKIIFIDKFNKYLLLNNIYKNNINLKLCY